jgi:hypothetical protein
MKKQSWQLRTSFVVLIAACVLQFTRVVTTQMQQSGGPGSSVSVSNIPHVVVDTAPTTAVTGTFWQATQPVSLASLPALAAGTALIGKVAPFTGCGTTVFSQAMVALPTSSTVVTATTTCVLALYFDNTNAGAQTVTVTDNAGTPLNVVGPGFSLPGLSNMTIPLDGVALSNGIKWLAGGTGVTGGVLGVQ